MRPFHKVIIMTSKSHRYNKNKKAKRSAVIKNIANDRNVSMAVAAHIYECYPQSRQKALRAKINFKEQ